MAAGDGSAQQVFGTGGGNVTLYDTTTHQILRIFTNVGSRVVFSPDQSWLIMGTANDAITVWDLQANAGARKIVQAGPVTSLALSPDGRILARANSTDEIALWELPSGQPLRALRAQRFAVFQVLFSPDGQWLLSAGGDQTIRRWRTDNWREAGLWRGHDDQVWSLAITPDGSRLFSSAKDETIREWSPAPPVAAPPLSSNANSVVPFAELGWLATGTRADGVTIWDAASSSPLGRFRKNAR